MAVLAASRQVLESESTGSSTTSLEEVKGLPWAFEVNIAIDGVQIVSVIKHNRDEARSLFLLLKDSINYQGSLSVKATGMGATSA